MQEYNFKPFDKVLVRDRDNFAWRADMFSHKTQDDGLYWCLGCVWRQCIPYEGNEHLLGTTDDPTPPKQKFKFGDKVEVRNTDDERWIKATFSKYYKANNKQYYAAITKYDVVAAKAWKQCRHADW